MTVGIVAVLCAIAIPSIITVNRSMNERDLDNSARAVYLAAQSNLAQMRSSGDLEKLAAMTWEADGAFRVPENDNAWLLNELAGDSPEPEDFDKAKEQIAQLRYTVTGTDAFELILPANVLDAQLREQQILIEYNPFSGHVYTVFYSEGEQELSYSLIDDRRDEAALKEKGIGYYCGGSVTIAPAEVNSTAVTLSADTDGQELIASVTVPVPESYTNHQDVFYNKISAELTIFGEMSKTELVISTLGNNTARSADSLYLTQDRGIGSPNYVEFSFVLDSLNTSEAFAKLNNRLHEMGRTERFTPGENLTLKASVNFEAPEGETILTFDEVVITGVNSLFAEMKENKDASGNVVSYEVELSNGRHLQNLNALDDSIAENVVSIKLVEDIYWNETVEYYETVKFTPVELSRTVENPRYPIATFDGVNHRVLYLDIEGTGNVGLFSLCEINVANLSIVSPIVKGGDYVGALAGYANGAVIENCSVYIDTEDKYFSWDKMEEYGVFSTEKDAGGLVGYATNGSFTDCFAAVNVDAAEYAGGFVGSSSGANASKCYASGSVTGKTAGGFVGYSENETYKKCFASGDVYADSVEGFAGGFIGKLECAQNDNNFGAYFEQCYAAGNVTGKETDATLKATVDGFCGTSNLKLTNDDNTALPYNAFESTETVRKLYSKTFYRIDKITTDESYYANAASYAQLAGERDENNLTVLGWTDKAVETHSYSLVENGKYPFLVYSENLHYYGEWPEEECPVALAYYEKYKDDNKPETKEIGFYISGESDSTLQHDRTVLKDGYVLLCQEELNASPMSLEGSDLPEAYKVYDPTDFDFDGVISGSFYDKVVVDLTIENVPTTFTLYYNPDFALTQLNPVIDETGKSQYSAKLPTTVGNIPSKNYIRTARHLAAIAENEDYQGSSYNYVQMIDVDFGTYNWGTDGYTMKSIADFAGSYTGTGGYVNQAKIVLKDGITLFTKITGKVSDVDIVAADLSGLEAGFVSLNEGEIINCTVGPVTRDMTGGLTYGFAAENRGIIRGSMANTAATEAAFVGTNSDTIADCYAWYPGTTAEGETKIVFAETDTGEIVSSYAAIYEKLDADNKVMEPAYVLVYDRDGVASFRDTLTGVTLGENWYSYSDKIIEEKGYYPYSTPEGISHRGGWDEFKEYKAFTGYYYYETYKDSTDTGIYIEIVGQDDKKPVNTLKDTVPATTAYGIFSVIPPKTTEDNPLEHAALTLNSAPIVPSELENDENESYIREQILKEFGEGYTCDMLKGLSSQSIYVLNGTKINTWFAPANEDGAYRIRTAEQFAAIEEFPGESFIQETDITIEKPLTYFEGTYDGNQKIITYKESVTITLNAANGEEVEIDDGNGGKTTVIRDNVAYGLFANITGENAVIKNCRVVGAIDIKESADKATAEHSVEITAAIGGLVGENHGTIKTSSVEGLMVTHTAATVTKGTSYTADIALGGLVGRMADGRLDECFVTGDIAVAADATDSIGGAVGVAAAEEEASVTCMDSYAAVSIKAPGATVGAFVGKADDGTFYYCHGWNGSTFIGAGANNARLLKCYYAQEIDGTYKIWTYDGSEVGSLSYESLAQWVERLNDDRGDIWDTKTTEVSKTGEIINGPHDTKYPVLAGRYDVNAVGAPNLYREPEVESVKLDAPDATEVPAETEESEATPDPTEQPGVTAEPEVTPEQSAEPEATETPAETPEHEMTPAPTAEPTPVPAENPVVDVTPEPTAEIKPVSEEV